MTDCPGSVRSRATSPDSLFSDKTQDDPCSTDVRPASRIGDIPGLYVFPSVLPSSIALSCLGSIASDDLFVGGSRDQVMLFYRPPPPIGSESDMPAYIRSLLSEVQRIINPLLSAEVRSTLWDQPLARQVILNLYTPGKGISAHVDLPHRYADGIVGVSLCGGCVISFSSLSAERQVDIYLPPRTVYVLSGEARWDWAHSIPPRSTDVILEEDGSTVTMIRESRVSVTFRWMKNGADELSEKA